MASGAQTLRLPPSPPQLEKFTYAAELIGILQKEIAALLETEAEADAVRKIVLRASINCRIIAADLLESADRAGDAGSIAMIAGFRLARGRDDIDHLLRAVLELGQSAAAPDAPPVEAARFQRVIDALRRYNMNAAEAKRRGAPVDPATLDPMLAGVFAPLMDAASIFENRAATSHWIPSGQITRTVAMLAVGSAAGAAASSSPTVDDLADRLAAAPLRDDTKQEITLLLDLLRQGAEFSDFRPHIAEYARLIAQALDTADAVAAAAWMSESSRSAYLERLHRALVLFRDKSTRAAGEQQLNRLRDSQLIVILINDLAARKVETIAIQNALLAADSRADNPAEADLGAQQLSKLRQVLQRMIDYRNIDASELSGDLKLVQKQLDKAYQRAEAALLNDIARLTSDPHALGDPAVSTLLADQAQYLDDLKRVRAIPDWIDTIRLLRPASAPAFTNQTRRMCQWLLDPTRRPDALAAMDQFQQQLSLFYPLPMEDQIRRGEPIVIQLTGGMQEQLIREIDQQRQKWAQSWGEGDAGGEAVNRMLLLYRLTQTMADMAEVSAIRGDASLLNRWAAWQLKGEILTRAMNDLPTRLRLACAAATGNNDAALRDHLDRIDRSAPIVKLAGRLSQVLDESLTTLPDGALGVLGACCNPPTTDSWMIQRRMEIAHLCRYALEMDYARSRGDEKAVETLAEYVNAVADSLLDDLGERRRNLPALIGFDGTQPLPKSDDDARKPRRGS